MADLQELERRIEEVRLMAEDALNQFPLRSTTTPGATRERHIHDLSKHIGGTGGGGTGSDHGSLTGLSDIADHAYALLVTGARAGSTSTRQDFGNTGIATDTVSESGTDQGVSIETSNFKDGNLIIGVADNKKIFLGASSDAEIYWTGSHLRIDPRAVTSTGMVEIVGDASGGIAGLGTLVLRDSTSTAAKITLAGSIVLASDTIIGFNAPFQSTTDPTDIIEDFEGHVRMKMVAAGNFVITSPNGAVDVLTVKGAGVDITGALTATSYGGITEANLLDKSATETVSGAYTFTATNPQIVLSPSDGSNAAFVLKPTAGDVPREWLTFSDTGDGSYGIYDSDAAARRVTIDTAGKMAIGAANPSNELDVQGGTGAPRIILSTTEDRVDANIAVQFEDGSGAHSAVGEFEGNFVVITGGTFRFFMKDDGSLGLNTGTATPGAQLHVDQSASDGNQPVLLLDQGDTGESVIVMTSDDADRDLDLIRVTVTGTPTIKWDEAADDFNFSTGVTVESREVNRYAYSVG